MGVDCGGNYYLVMATRCGCILVFPKAWPVAYPPTSHQMSLVIWLLFRISGGLGVRRSHQMVLVIWLLFRISGGLGVRREALAAYCEGWSRSITTGNKTARRPCAHTCFQIESVPCSLPRGFSWVFNSPGVEFPVGGFSAVSSTSPCSHIEVLESRREPSVL